MSCYLITALFLVTLTVCLTTTEDLTAYGGAAFYNFDIGKYFLFYTRQRLSMFNIVIIILSLLIVENSKKILEF